MRKVLFLLSFLLYSSVINAQGQNFPGGGAITGVASLPATCTPGTTAPVQLTVAPYAVYTCTATNTWTSAGPGLGTGSGAAPNLEVTVSPNCPAGNTGTPTCVNAFFDVTVVPDGTTTSGSNIVTSPTAKFQTGPHPAVVGEIFFANDNTASSGGNSCYDNPDILFGGLRQTTISSVDSDTQIHVVGNSGTTSTAHACMAWGHDDTTAINAAWAAGGCYSSIRLPNAKAFISAPIFQFAALTGCPTAFGFAPGPGQAIWGSSVGGTYLIPTPLFNFTSITGGGGFTCTPISCTAAIGSPSIFDYENINVWGLGERCSATLANTSLWDIGISTRAVSANGYGWCARGGGATLVGFNINGGTDIYTWGGSIYFGSVLMSFNASYIDFGNSFDAGNNAGTVGNCGVMVQPTAIVYSHGNAIQTCLQVGTAGGAATTWNSYMTQIQGNDNGGACIYVGNNSIVNLTAGDVVCLAPITNESGETFLGTGGVIRNIGSTHFANGTGTVVLGVAGNTFDDTNGNTYSGGAGFWNGLGTWKADTHSMKGTCTGTATSSTTLGLYGTGPNETLTTCTSTTIGSGVAINGARTVQNLSVTATHAGFSASSGVVTVLKNGGATTITCTIGTGTSCIDQTHAVAFADGDLLSIQFTTQATEVLAGVKALVMWY